MTTAVEALECRRLFAGISLGTDGLLLVTGTAGNDVIVIELAAGSIVAKLNGASKSYAASSVARIRLAGEAGGDQMTLSSTVVKPATLLGGPGVDTLRGGGGNDTLDGGIGPDVMFGGPGVDTVDYSTRTKSLYVQIEDGANDGELGERDNVRSDIENINGGKGGDRLYGNIYNNAINGNGGDDRIFGFGGNDVLRGGASEDFLDGGDGNDALHGDDGVDVMRGGKGADDFWGGADNSAGGIIARSMNAGDLVDYSDIAGYVVASIDNQRNDGLSGENDFIHSDVEGLVASKGGSTLVGSNVANYLVDGPGDDTLIGNGGEDSLFANLGNNKLYGGSGDDDITSGSPGADEIFGGDGDDQISSTFGADKLFGGLGTDMLNDRSGGMVLDGGPGTDLINHVAEAALLTATKSADGKVVTIRGTGLADELDITATSGNGLTVSNFGQFPISVSLVGVQQVVVEGLGRGDRIGFGYFDGTLSAKVTLRGGAGNDEMESAYFAPGVDMYGGAGDDSLEGGTGNDRLFGGDGDDRLNGSAGADQLYGNAGDDSLYGDDGAADYLDGGLGYDRADRDENDVLFSIEYVD